MTVSGAPFTLAAAVREAPLRDRRWSRAHERETVRLVFGDLTGRGLLAGQACARRTVRNRNTTGYLLTDGTQKFFLKLFVTSAPDAAAAEYQALMDLRERWRHAAVRFPAPVAVYPEHAALAMEFVPGPSFKLVLRATCRRGHILPAFLIRDVEQLADALYQFHSMKGAPAPDSAVTSRLIDDLAWGVDRIWPDVWRGLRQALPAQLRTHAFETAEVYGDFEPANVIKLGDSKVLLEPSPRRTINHVHRDIAVFHIGLLKAGWHPRYVLWYDFEAADRLFDYFVQGYFDRLGRSVTDADHLLIALWELVRMGELTTWARRFLRYRQRLSGLGWWVFSAPIYHRTVARINAQIHRRSVFTSMGV
jgi:hypothetical protein